MAHLGYTRAQVHEAFCQVDPALFLKPEPRLNAFLAKLAAEYKMGIISNFRHVQVEKTLAALGVVLDLFSFVIGEEDVVEIKPSTDPFLRALERAGEEPGHCVYIAGQLTKDFPPARQLGIRTIWVNPEGDASSDLVDAVIPSVFELRAALKLE
jgi:FMN phosphatase YigB (HAD superfamily)